MTASDIDYRKDADTILNLKPEALRLAILP
jgi:hypothetical protein